MKRRDFLNYTATLASETLFSSALLDSFFISSAQVKKFLSIVYAACFIPMRPLSSCLPLPFSRLFLLLHPVDLIFLQDFRIRDLNDKFDSLEFRPWQQVQQAPTRHWREDLSP